MSNPENINKTESSDYIEEEVIVYIDIEKTSIPEDEIRRAKALNLVTNNENCLLQINNRFFEGKMDFSIGTHVFFEKNEEIEIDPLYSHSGPYEYDIKAKTNKIVSMNRVLLKDITDKDDESANRNEPKIDDLKISRTYEQALNLFLSPNRAAPRKINEEDERILLEAINPQHLEMECEDVGSLTEAMEISNIKTES